MAEISDDLRQYLLSLADDEHLMGQRHAEWIGVAPFLEEDLAFASIGQDELGHAVSIYQLLVGQDDLAVDRLAFRRPADEYRSCWLVEYDTNEWAETLVRHWFYDSVEHHRWELLAGTSNSDVASLAERALGEESYHLRHANGLLDVLLAADESRRRIDFAAATLWPLALGLFDGVAEEAALVADGILPAPLVDRLPRWRSEVKQRFPTVDWQSLSREDCRVEQQGRIRRHEDFDRLYTRMREVMKFDPDAVW